MKRMKTEHDELKINPIQTREGLGERKELKGAKPIVEDNQENPNKFIPLKRIKVVETFSSS